MKPQANTNWLNWCCDGFVQLSFKFLLTEPSLSKCFLWALVQKDVGVQSNGFSQRRVWRAGGIGGVNCDKPKMFFSTYICELQDSAVSYALPFS